MTLKPSRASALTGKAPKLVSPSRIARYYFHECERFLRYTSTPSSLRGLEGVPPTPYETSPVTRAILDAGYSWEEQVVRDILGARVHVAPADPQTPIRDRVFSAQASRELLVHMQPGELLYQPTLTTPSRLYQTYGLDPAVVAVTDCRPDLIECVESENGQIQLRVIDVKASPGVKLSHRIQATLYTLILEALLAEWDSERTVSSTPGIWLGAANAAELFDIRAMRPPLETFLTDELQALMERPAREARWHVYYRCEWCEYFESCRQEMSETNDVSRVPYLSSHAKRFLAELDPPVHSLDDLAELLRTPDREALDDCASLRGRQDRLAVQVASLRTGSIATQDGSSLAMPKGEHIRLIFTLQTEPVSGRAYTFGIYAQGVRDVIGQMRPIVDVAGSPEDSDDLERAFIRALHDLLDRVHHYNEALAADWKAQKTVQVYAFDTYEADTLNDLLVRRLLDPEVADVALQLFFYFQQPDLARADNHPANEVFFPVVNLIAVLRQLCALPVDVSYRFADMVRLVKPTQFAFDYREDSFFNFALSNQMRSDAIYGVWHRDRAEFVDSILKEVHRRLYGTNSVINGLRELLEPSQALFAWPPRFNWPAGFSFHRPVLSRLAFIARYESVLAYIGLRGARMRPLEERLRAADVVPLTHAGGDTFALATRQDLDLEASGFPNWLLTAETDEGNRAALSYDDYRNRNRSWVPRNSPLSLAAIDDVSADASGRILRLRLGLRTGEQSPSIQSRHGYLLHPRFTDYTTEHVVDELRDEDATTESRFTALVTEGVRSAQPGSISADVQERAVAIARAAGMREPQLAAFSRLLGNDLHLVWGPPGTGKTHFLALATLSLAEAYRQRGVPFRVLVTAFTHAAIDNCLRKIDELAHQVPDLAGAAAVGKLRRFALSDMGSVQLVLDGDGDSWLSSHPQTILGGTAWAIRKSIAVGGVDLVVIDEGAQLRVPESAISIRRLNTSGTLVVAGDHRQLRPIVQGDYPEAEIGPPLHRSIFECLMAQDASGAVTSTLYENFRMSATLCHYPAKQIYSPEYASATSEIAARRLRLRGKRGDELEDLLVDPDYPLVVAVLEGVRASAENRTEASLVAATAVRLRERLVGGDDELYATTVDGDAAFWKQGLFVVSPHHAQIHSIRRELRRRRKWLSAPFVDTVDKMQGQECDAVITSYGVADVEYAMGEKEFIYSLNRLNVSITRARAKTIVFLPRPLIDPPVQAFEDDAIAEGVAFMQGLVQFAEREGETSRHDLTAGANLVLYRVS